MRALAPALAAAWLAACGQDDGAAALARDIAACEGGMFPEQRLTACSAVIANASAERWDRADALVQRGMLRASLGQHARAVADFGRALRIDASLANAYAQRALIHQERGAYDRAISDFDAALALDPNMPAAIQGRAQVLSSQAQTFQSQIDALTQALLRTPDDAGLLNNRCWIRAVSGEELDQALVDCNAALLLEPANAAALDSRGLVYLKLGAFESALADYDAALAIEPGRGHYLYGRAMARWGLGQPSEADFAEAEAAEPAVSSLYASYRATPETLATGGAAPAQP